MVQAETMNISRGVGMSAAPETERPIQLRGRELQGLLGGKSHLIVN